MGKKVQFCNVAIQRRIMNSSMKFMEKISTRRTGTEDAEPSNMGRRCLDKGGRRPCQRPLISGKLRMGRHGGHPSKGHRRRRFGGRLRRQRLFIAIRPIIFLDEIPDMALLRKLSPANIDYL